MRKGSAELFRRDFRMRGKSDGTCGATFGQIETSGGMESKPQRGRLYFAGGAGYWRTTQACGPLVLSLLS
jgi:hypothetical protein